MPACQQHAQLREAREEGDEEERFENDRRRHRVAVLDVRGNQARNARRTRARREALLTSLSPREEARALDEMLLVAEAHVQLTGCLLTLQELPRAVVTARLLDERTGDDVARELSLTPGHVAVLLHRARKRLESCMARFHEFTRQRSRAAAS